MAREKCKKCGGLTYYDPPRYFGDSGSYRCVICGMRIMEEITVTVPQIPAPGMHAKKMTKSERLAKTAAINEASKMRKRNLKAQ